MFQKNKHVKMTCMNWLKIWKGDSEYMSGASICLIKSSFLTLTGIPRNLEKKKKVSHALFFFFF